MTEETKDSIKLIVFYIVSLVLVIAFIILGQEYGFIRKGM